MTQSLIDKMEAAKATDYEQSDRDFNIGVSACISIVRSHFVSREEAVAKEIYLAMCWAVTNAPADGRGTPSWHEAGNSDAQEIARKVAKGSIAALEIGHE